MHKPLFFGLMMLLSIFRSNAQELPTIDWTVSLAGSSGYGDFTSIAIAPNSDVVVAGHINGNDVDIDPGPGVIQTSGTGYPDLLMMRLDSSGTVLWFDTVTGLSVAQAGSASSMPACAVDAFGNMIFAGDVEDTATFNPAGNSFTFEPQYPGADNPFVVKYSATGSLLMSIFMEPTDSSAIGGSTNIYDMALAPNGDIAIGGILDGNYDLDPGAGVAIASSNQGQGFVAVYDSTGAYLWHQIFNGSTNCERLDYDPGGNLLISGVFFNSVLLDPMGSSVASLGFSEVFVTQYDATGNYVWGTTCGGASHNALGDMEVNSAGEAIIVMNYDSDDVFVPNSNDPSDTVVQNVDTCGGFRKALLVFDASGNYVWGIGIGDCNAVLNHASSVGLDHSENIIVHGKHSTSQGPTWDVDPGPGVSSLPIGSQNEWIAKFSSAGSLISQWTLNGVTSSGLEMEAGGPNELYFAGGSQWAFGAWEPNTGVVNVQDLALVKYKDCGALEVTPLASTSEICSGSSVTLSVTQGADSLVWSNGAATGVPQFPTSDTQYILTGYNNDGCWDTTSVSVIVHDPQVTANTTLASVCSTQVFTLYGSGADTYVWDNGVTNAGQVTAINTTTYNVTGTDAYGCTDTGQVTVTVLPIPTVSIVASSTVVCDYESVTLTASGAQTYFWDPSITNGVPFFPSTSGTYDVSGFSANGCPGYASIAITVNPSPPVVANASPAVVCEGSSLTLTGSGAQSYTWSNGVVDGVSFQPAATNTYTVTATGSNGCVATDQVTVPVSTISISIASSDPDNEVCEGVPITLTGSGASTYNWDNGITNGQSFNPTTTQTYTLIGTNSDGCPDTLTQTVDVNPLPIILQVVTSDLICNGDNSGAINAITSSGTGTIQYSLDGGTTYPYTSGNITGLSPGTYDLALTDDAGCTTIGNSYTITEPPVLSIVTQNATDNTSCGSMSGSISVAGSGGVAPISYSINGGTSFSGSTNFTNLASGLYPIVIKDQNGCEVEGNVLTIADPTSISIASVTSSDVSSCTAIDGTITVSASGGTGALQYSSNGGNSYMSNGGVFTNLSQGTYLVLVRDEDHCVQPAEAVSIGGPGIEVTSLTSSDISDCTGSNDGTITIQISGAVGLLSYSIDGGSTFQNNNGAYTGLAAGSYDIVVEDNTSNCTTTAGPIVLTEPEIGLSGNVNPASSGGATDGSITTTVSPGTAPFTYNWSNGSNAASLSNLAPGSYTCTVTDANGCSATQAFNVVVVGIDDLGAVETLQLFPNPTATDGTIAFTLNNAAIVSIELLSATGSRARTILAADQLAAGTHSQTISVDGLAAGVYFVRFTANQSSQWLRLVIAP